MHVTAINRKTNNMNFAQDCYKILMYLNLKLCDDGSELGQQWQKQLSKKIYFEL